ncbi:hypothetical protein Pla52n_08080 [Stieleria varia]|uniref:Uncharacterized protein n=1 Tax=Stieleria varia TaxID=2528005 RepID=A0A5C6BAC8_9BACT|nr:hypothetical protein Pla52n_08080 [Stieleria varia]
MYADFGDFAFYRLPVIEAHLVAGFGRIQTLTPDQLRDTWRASGFPESEII